MGFSVGNEAYIFLCSIIGGAVIAFIYDLFRIRRKAIKVNNIIVYIEDIVYWIIVAAIMFGVVYYSNDGQLRGFLFLGTAIGSVLYILLLSRLVINTSMLVIRFVYKIISTAWFIILYPFKIIFGILKIPAAFIIRIAGKLLRKTGRAGKSKIKNLHAFGKRFNKIRKKF